MVTPSAMKFVEPMNRPGLSSNSARLALGPDRPDGSGRTNAPSVESEVQPASRSPDCAIQPAPLDRSRKKGKKDTTPATTAGLADLIASECDGDHSEYRGGSTPLVRYYHDP